MLKPEDLSFLDESAEDPSELLKALPEIRHDVSAAPADEDLGIRTLLERPEAFAHAWWRDQARRGRVSSRAMSP